MYVKLPDGRSVPVSVTSTDPVSSVLAALADEEDLDADSYHYHVRISHSYLNIYNTLTLAYLTQYYTHTILYNTLTSSYLIPHTILYNTLNVYGKARLSIFENICKFIIRIIKYMYLEMEHS